MFDVFVYFSCSDPYVFRFDNIHRAKQEYNLWIKAQEYRKQHGKCEQITKVEITKYKI